MPDHGEPIAGKLLMTGARGRLGAELCRLLPEAIATDVAEMDITDPARIAEVLERERPSTLLHAAAYTDVAGAERDRATCWRVNVTGARNVAEAARERRIRLVHISTDYVFEGTTGGYGEDDTPGPTRNYYALTKLVAEELARTAPRHLVIRTSFRPREWPYEIAVTDLYTSQDYIDVIAPEIALAVSRIEEIPFTTLHIATERKSVFELARRRKADVRPGRRADLPVSLPEDISLDVSRWLALKKEWGVA